MNRVNLFYLRTKEYNKNKSKEGCKREIRREAS